MACADAIGTPKSRDVIIRMSWDTADHPNVFSPE